MRVFDYDTHTRSNKSAFTVYAFFRHLSKRTRFLLILLINDGMEFQTHVRRWPFRGNWKVDGQFMKGERKGMQVEF